MAPRGYRAAKGSTHSLSLEEKADHLATKADHIVQLAHMSNIQLSMSTHPQCIPALVQTLERLRCYEVVAPKGWQPRAVTPRKLEVGSNYETVGEQAVRDLAALLQAMEPVVFSEKAAKGLWKRGQRQHNQNTLMEYIEALTGYDAAHHLLDER